MKIKCMMDGKECECKVLDNLGFQGGYHAKEVEYNGMPKIVVKRNGRWEAWTASDRTGANHV